MMTVMMTVMMADDDGISIRCEGRSCQTDATHTSERRAASDSQQATATRNQSINQLSNQSSDSQRATRIKPWQAQRKRPYLANYLHSVNQSINQSIKRLYFANYLHSVDKALRPSPLPAATAAQSSHGNFPSAHRPTTLSEAITSYDHHIISWGMHQLWAHLSKSTLCRHQLRSSHHQLGDASAVGPPVEINGQSGGLQRR